MFRLALRLTRSLYYIVMLSHNRNNLNVDFRVVLNECGCDCDFALFDLLQFIQAQKKIRQQFDVHCKGLSFVCAVFVFHSPEMYRISNYYDFYNYSIDKYYDSLSFLQRCLAAPAKDFVKFRFDYG